MVMIELSTIGIFVCMRAMWRKWLCINTTYDWYTKKKNENRFRRKRWITREMRAIPFHTSQQNKNSNVISI